MSHPTDPVWAAISTRRAIRRFQPRPLEPAHRARILDAARRANNSKNEQSWAFIACEDRAHLEALAAVGPFAGHLAGAAMAVALVGPHPDVARAPHSVFFDLGQAAATMMLAAWELGIGSVPATVYEPELTRQLLGYPEDRHCGFLISFGYPLDPDDLIRPARPGGRTPLDDLVHEERW